MEHQQAMQQLNQQQSKPGFVLGNGKSRLNLNLEAIKSRAIVYGCNALYREFEPDHLVAVDVKMINEIVAAGYNKTHSVWTNPNKGIIAKTNVNFFSPHKGWSSGPTALWLACQQGHQTIYIFGFDYAGEEGKFNNVYADTFNYKKSSDAATFFGNWLSQTEKTVKDNPNVKFFRVVEEGTFIPDKLVGIPNLQNITYEQFQQRVPGCTYNIEHLQKTTI